MTRLFQALLCFTLLTGTAFAADTVSYSFAGCKDSRDRPVVSQADPSLPVLLETRLVEGNRVIFYNPAMLPQMLQETRAFLYAHECAWTRLGLPINRERSPEAAHRADCWAIETLTRSKIIKSAGDLDAIESDIALLADQAKLLPLPARELRLASCPVGQILKDKAPKAAKGNVLDLNTSPASPAWTQCIQACGNRLYACGRSNACMTSFDQCRAACGDSGK